MKSKSEVKNSSGFSSSINLPLLVWITFALFFLFLQFRSLNSYNLELFPDSGRYVFPTPVFSLENSGILTSLFFRAFDGFIGINAMQVFTSAVAWLFFSFVMLNTFDRYWGLLGSVLILAFALQVSIINWNYLALSESLSISITVMWFAWCLWIYAGKSQMIKRFLFYLVSISQVLFLLVLLVRPQLILVAAPLQFLFLFFATKGWDRKISIIQYSIFLFFAAVGALRLVVASLGSPFKGAYSGHLLENRPDFASHAYSKFDCYGIVGSGDGILEKVKAQCPNMFDSLSQGVPSFISWTLEEPLVALRSGMEWLVNQSKLVDYSSDVFIISEEFGNFLTPTYSPLIEIYVWLLVGGLIFGIFAFRNYKINSVNLMMWLVLNVTSGAFIFVSWGVDGIELERHAMPMLALLPIFSAVLAALVFAQKRVSSRDVHELRDA